MGFVILICLRKKVHWVFLGLATLNCMCCFTYTLLFFLWDAWLDNCYVRVKVTYSLVLIQATTYWSLQVYLVLAFTKNIERNMALAIKGVCGFLFILRVAVGLWTLTEYTFARAANTVCLSKLPAQQNIIDKTTEILFDVVMASLFIGLLFFLNKQGMGKKSSIYEM